MENGALFSLSLVLIQVSKYLPIVFSCFQKTRFYVVAQVIPNKVINVITVAESINIYHVEIFYIPDDLPANIFCFLRRLEDDLKMSFTEEFFIFQDVFKTCLQDAFQRNLQDVFAERLLQDVFRKTFCKQDMMMS